MLLSLQDMFSNAQTLSVDVGTNDSTNTLNWGAHGDDIGGLLTWTVQIMNTAASDGAATLQIIWYTSEDGDSWTAVYTGTANAKASVVAGAMLIDGEFLPRNLKMYNKLVYTTGIAAWTTAPIVTAYLTDNGMKRT